MRDRKGDGAAKVRGWLISLREEKGLTQGHVANAVGIAQPTYYEYEKGISTPKPENAKKIAAVLGCDWTQFYADGDDKEDNEEVTA